MHKTELNGGTGSTISITGGDIILKRADWVDDRTVSVRVARMGADFLYPRCDGPRRLRREPVT